MIRPPCNSSSIGKRLREPDPLDGNNMDLICRPHISGNPQWQRLQRPPCSVTENAGSRVMVNYNNGTQQKTLECTTGMGGLYGSANEQDYKWREPGLLMNEDPFDHIENETFYDIEVKGMTKDSYYSSGLKSAVQLGGDFLMKSGINYLGDKFGLSDEMKKMMKTGYDRNVTSQLSKGAANVIASGSTDGMKKGMQNVIMGAKMSIDESRDLAMKRGRCIQNCESTHTTEESKPKLEKCISSCNEALTMSYGDMAQNTASIAAMNTFTNYMDLNQRDFRNMAIGNINAREMARAKLMSDHNSGKIYEERPEVTESLDDDANKQPIHPQIT